MSSEDSRDPKKNQILHKKIRKMSDQLNFKKLNKQSIYNEKNKEQQNQNLKHNSPKFIKNPSFKIIYNENQNIVEISSDEENVNFNQISSQRTQNCSQINDVSITTEFEKYNQIVLDNSLNCYETCFDYHSVDNKSNFQENQTQQNGEEPLTQSDSKIVFRQNLEPNNLYVETNFKLKQFEFSSFQSNSQKTQKCGTKQEPKKIKIQQIDQHQYMQDNLITAIENEKNYQFNRNYCHMDQVIIDQQKRAILIDWMMEVCCDLKLSKSTFYLSVYVIDAYFSRKAEQIQVNEIQLIGAAALYISAKKEEVSIQEINPFREATDNIYTNQQILDSEQQILKSLQYYLNPSTLYFWLTTLTYIWDQFLNSYFKIENFENMFKIKQKRKFKNLYFCNSNNNNNNKTSKLNTLLLTTMMDCTVFNTSLLQFSEKHIILAFLFLYIQVKSDETEAPLEQLIQYNFYQSINSENSEFLKMFQDFLVFSNLETFCEIDTDILPILPEILNYFILILQEKSISQYYQKFVDQTELEEHEFKYIQLYNTKFLTFLQEQQ